MAADDYDPDEVHARALKRFDAAAMAYQPDRAECLQSRRFVFVTGAQWEDAWGEVFANSIRPEINKTAEGLQKIINDYRANRVTVNFRATDDTGDPDTAETLDGMFRADVYNSKGGLAFDNAFWDGSSGGIGAWRLTTRYVNEYDPDDERQRICFEPIVDPEISVFFDPNSKLYDKSDAQWCTVVTPYTMEAFRAEFGEDADCGWPIGIVKPYYEWYAPDTVYVGEYYEVEVRKSSRLVFEHVLTKESQRYWADEIDDEARDEMEAQGWRLRAERRMDRRRVHKYIMSGSEILEDQGYIAGQNIPIVWYAGQWAWIDRKERVRGHVANAKDPQRVYNAQIGKLTETAATAPIERPIFTPEQIAGHETSWAEANLNRAPYALINPLMDPATGSLVQTGQVGSVQPPQLSPVLAALIQITANDIRELTNADDGADEARSNISAEAMDIAATRTDQKSEIYMDNFKLSMQRCGEIYISMAADIYVEDGRKVPTLGEDGEEGSAILMEPYTDPQSGNFYIRNDFSAGQYKVISDVTEATVTRRDKTVKTLLNVANVAQQVDPELAAASLNTALINMDGEGMGDLQDWIRQRLVKQGVVKPTEEESQALAEAAANQKPDAQTQALEAMAQKEAKLAEKAGADTQLSGAKMLLTLAQAEETAAKTGKTVEETANIGREAMQPEAVE